MNSFAGRLEGNIREVVTAGRAEVTIRNTKTGGRLTYRLRLPSKKNRGGWCQPDRNATVLFVSLLCGADNEEDYRFIGTLFMESGDFRWSGKGGVSRESVGVRGFEWFSRHMDFLPGYVEVWHSGRCCRCGRKLTVPESIATGMGPECASRAG